MPIGKAYSNSQARGVKGWAQDGMQEFPLRRKEKSGGRPFAPGQDHGTGPYASADMGKDPVTNPGRVETADGDGF